jgi:hypothetical protein
MRQPNSRYDSVHSVAYVGDDYNDHEVGPVTHFNHDAIRFDDQPEPEKDSVLNDE